MTTHLLCRGRKDGADHRGRYRHAGGSHQRVETVRSALESITDDWPPADRQALARLLTRFNQAIEYRSGRTWPR